MICARTACVVALVALLGVGAPQAGGVPWGAGEVAALHARLDAALGDPFLRGAHVGFIAIDTERGTLLYERNADDEMRGASNFKLLVGSAALRDLGSNFRFVTTLQADAFPLNGHVAGNVYLRGGGDAHLSAEDLTDAAAQLRRAGITSVNGALVTDASHDDATRYPPGWSWDDLAEEYGPVVTALELQDGVTHVYVSPGAAPGDPVRLRTDAPTDALTIENDAVTGPPRSDDTTDVERPWNAPEAIRVVGSYPLGASESDDLEPSLPDPQRYAGRVLLRAMNAAGIVVTGGLRSGATPSSSVTLWRHDSPAMPQLLAEFWLPSDNLMGELFLKELGVARAGEPGTYAGGIAAERAYLSSISVDNATVSISDGSGSSAYDLITPRDLITILQSDWNRSERDAVIAALPQAGVNGTLIHSFAGTPLRGRVFAKTGSETHVRALSGFLQTERHGPVTFSFIINDWMGDRRPDTRAELEHVEQRLLLTLSAAHDDAVDIDSTREKGTENAGGSAALWITPHAQLGARPPLTDKRAGVQPSLHAAKVRVRGVPPLWMRGASYLDDLLNDTYLVDRVGRRVRHGQKSFVLLQAVQLIKRLPERRVYKGRTALFQFGKDICARTAVDEEVPCIVVC